MQKWEYLCVKLDTFGLNQQNAAVREVNEQQLKDWKQTYVHTFINQLGTEGWEMSGAYNPYGDSQHNYLFFKRPKP